MLRRFPRRVAWPVPRLAALAVVSLLACAAGCGDAARDAGEGTRDPIAERVAYDAAWQIATHNSYWVDRTVPNDLFASGVGERLLDQLLIDGVRTLEIDIHAEPSRPGGFTVFHTVPGNSVCARLDDCLATLRTLAWALPRHEVVTVVLELKGILEPTFDARHTPEDLDRVLEEQLGARLYRPADLLARCGATGGAGGAGGVSGGSGRGVLLDGLAACAERGGWPSLDELRGRVIATVLGNWDELGGAQATRDWVDYAIGAPIATRAAFPMASSWKLSRDALLPRLQAIVSQADLDRSFAQSAFLQIQDLADPRIDPFLARRGVIRVDGAFAAADQAVRIERRMQLLQTDFPWVLLDAAGATPLAPLRPFDADLRAALREPGARIALSPADGAAAGGEAFAHLPPARDAASATWEAAVSSRAGAAGCLRAAVAPAPGADGITLCRVKHAAGASAERVDVRVERCAGGECAITLVEGGLDEVGGSGDLLAIDVEDGAAGPATCARVRSSDFIAPDGAPRWIEVGEAACFAGPLRYQGIARRSGASGDDGSAVVFFGVRRAADGEPPAAIEADDLVAAAAG